MSWPTRGLTRHRPPVAVRPADPPILTPARFDADVLDNPRPAYPALASRYGEEGRVLLRVRVAEDGRASEIGVLEGSGHPRLDRAAREAVARWRFVTARQGRASMESRTLMPISFSLG